MAGDLSKRRPWWLPSLVMVVIVAAAASDSNVAARAVERRTRLDGSQGAVSITVLYDNREFEPGLTPSWGFAALVELPTGTYLWDTGGDGPTLLGNMRRLSIPSEPISAVLLSHEHGDHTGGLVDLLRQGVQPPVYVLPSFSSELKRRIGELTEMIIVEPGMRIGPDVMTTGEVAGPTAEQALVLETDSGLVIVTGCAHPGIVELVARARDLVDAPVHLVLGGFHLADKSADDVAKTIADLKQLGVQKVGPTHCTGDQAIAMFRAAFGEAFVEVGLGRTVRVPGPSITPP